MHSFHHSRGRIFFEVLCALGMAASCAVAWRQTGATALLAAAGIAAIYSVVHLFDMRRGKPNEAAEPQRIDFAPEAQEPSLAKTGIEESVVVEPKAPRSSKSGAAKAPRKGGGVRKAPKVAEPAPSPEAVVLSLAPDEAVSSEPMPIDEAGHPPVAPLFEPDPFVRMVRPAFGRKAG